MLRSRGLPAPTDAAITVVVATWRAASTTAGRPPAPRRTMRRWLTWFATEAMRTRCVTALRARVTPSLEPGEVLPGALSVIA